MENYEEKQIRMLAVDIYASCVPIEGTDMARGVDLKNRKDNYSAIAKYLFISGWRKEPMDDEYNKRSFEHDNVNHPSHYTDGKMEVIDFIEDKGLNFHRGNAVKYIARAGKKDRFKEVEDLEKAAWYINREIERLKRLKEEDCEEFLKKFEEENKQ